MEKRTLVIGASTKPERFSYRAIRSLVSHSFPVFAMGLRNGEVSGIKLEKPLTVFEDIHTITMYIGPVHQPFYYEYILRLSPKRVIFNPGTENKEFERMLCNKGIEVIHDCTLVMLVNEEY